MVTARAFLPTSEELRLLRALSAPIVVRSIMPSRNRLASVVLASRDGAVRLRGNYDDVVFKFECFYVSVEAADFRGEPPRDPSMLDPWDEVRCVFQFEWERPALPNEVPPHYVQIMGDWGARDQFPDNAVALGVPFAGLSLHRRQQDGPAAMILCDVKEEPGNLVFIADTNKLRAIASRTEIVSLEEVPQWIEDLKIWAANRNIPLRTD